VIGPEIAAVERREARLPVTRQVGAFVEVPDVICAVPALRSLMGMREERRGRTPRPPNNRGDDACLFDRIAHETMCPGATPA